MLPTLSPGLCHRSGTRFGALESKAAQAELKGGPRTVKGKGGGKAEVRQEERKAKKEN